MRGARGDSLEVTEAEPGPEAEVLVREVRDRCCGISLLACKPHEAYMRLTEGEFFVLSLCTVLRTKERPADNSGWLDPPVSGLYPRGLVSAKCHQGLALTWACVLSGSSGCFLPTWWPCSGMPTWPPWGSEDGRRDVRAPLS